MCVRVGVWRGERGRCPESFFSSKGKGQAGSKEGGAQTPSFVPSATAGFVLGNLVGGIESQTPSLCILPVLSIQRGCNHSEQEESCLCLESNMPGIAQTQMDPNHRLSHAASVTF